MAILLPFIMAYDIDGNNLGTKYIMWGVEFKCWQMSNHLIMYMTQGSADQCTPSKLMSEALPLVLNTNSTQLYWSHLRLGCTGWALAKSVRPLWNVEYRFGDASSDLDFLLCDLLKGKMSLLPSSLDITVFASTPLDGAFTWGPPLHCFKLNDSDLSSSPLDGFTSGWR